MVCRLVGVPVISPVEVSKVSPAGSVGEMLQEVAERLRFVVRRMSLASAATVL